LASRERKRPEGSSGRVRSRLAEKFDPGVIKARKVAADKDKVVEPLRLAAEILRPRGKKTTAPTN
jgi:hypothetical protein